MVNSIWQHLWWKMLHEVLYNPPLNAFSISCTIASPAATPSVCGYVGETSGGGILRCRVVQFVQQVTPWKEIRILIRAFRF